MLLQVLIRPGLENEGKAIYAVENIAAKNPVVVNKEYFVAYSDNHVSHAVAAAVPDAELEFHPTEVIRGASAVVFTIEQETPRAVIGGMDKRVGAAFELKGMIFSISEVAESE